jgi:hypothetical protein
MPASETSSLAAAGGAGGGDDISLGHLCFSLIILELMGAGLRYALRLSQSIN